MTSKERVWKAYRHQEADRVPVGEMHIMSPVSSEILGREAITGEGGWLKYTEMKMIQEGRRKEFIERLSVDTRDVFTKSGLDLICTELDPPDDGSFEFRDITENTWTRLETDTGAWAKFVYKPENDTAHEVDSTEKQDEEYDAIEAHLDAMEKRGFDIPDSRFESTKYMAEHAKDMFLMAKVPDLIPSYRSFYAKFMEMMAVDEDLTQRLCDIYLKYGLAVVKKYKELGLDCVMIATDWAASNGPIFAPSLLRKYLIPQIQGICKYCHDNNMLVLKHTDGNIMQFAEDFFAMDIDGYQSVDPGAGMDIALVKQKYGHKVLLMGNVDCARTLPYGTTEEVIEETKSVMRKASKGGGHIVSSSNTIGFPTTKRNFFTMVETVHKFGSYPLNI
jgi:uroporphyrinogen decarboxylase